MTKFWQAATIALAAGAVCVAAQAKAGETIAAGDLEWKEIVPGASFAAAYGDWEKGGHGKFVRIQRGAQIPMHTHSNDYRAVVVSGRMVNLFGGDQKTEVAPGDYFYMAAKRPHSHQCLSEEGCVFYTYGDRLWDIEVIAAE